MANTSPLRPLALAFLALVVGLLALTVYTATPAQAMQASVCTTDLDCVALELDQAIRLGEQVHEDLSWSGMSPLASAKNELLADAFWADHAGQDWDEARQDLLPWIALYRAC